MLGLLANLISIDNQKNCLECVSLSWKDQIPNLPKDDT